jgi:hypothetical protein
MAALQSDWTVIEDILANAADETDVQSLELLFKFLHTKRIIFRRVGSHTSSYSSLN